MSRRMAGRGETIRNAGALLAVMGSCRKALLEAQDSVKPFGVMHHGCGMVTAAIDALAHLVTGQPHYYSIGGSAPRHEASGASGQPPEV